MMIRLTFPLLLLLASCASRAASTQFTSHSALEEVRIALLDVRQAFSAQQMELQILEERVDQVNPNAAKTVQIADLESRISQLELTHQQIRADLRELGSHANNTTSSLKQFNLELNHLAKRLETQHARLNEVGKLKGTLSNISKALNQQSSTSQVYTVRSGDTLEKIARRHDTTVQALKTANNLSSTRIYIGQKLTLP